MLFHILASRAKQSPEKTALVYGTSRIRYADLYEQVRDFSNGLRACGLTSADSVALLLPNCPEFIISFYAVARLRASVVALNNLLQKHELKYCLQDSWVRMVITTVQGAEVCHQLLSELKQPIELIVIDGVYHAATPFRDVMHSTAVDTAAPDLDMTYDGPVLYQYSSGSTGRPKRVERTQRNLVSETENFLATTQVTSTDTFLCVVPLFHAHGLGNCMLAAIGVGATLVVLERVVHDGLTVEVPFPARCHEVLQLIEQEHITVFPAVPYIFAALAEAVQQQSTQLASLRLCFSAGNFLPKPTFDLFLQRFGVPIRQQYGCTEAGSVTINLEDAKDLHFDSVGLPMKNVAVIVVDDAMREVPPGVIGEIAILSPALTAGYCDMQELNRQVFRNGYFFPGDLGKKDQDGNLYITGRKRVIIDTGGRKVDPLEIEDVLATHPQVAEAVVVGVAGPYGGEVIKAVIVPQSPCTEQELVAYCRDRMASYKVPRVIEFRQAIPRSPLGKVLRKDLTQPASLNWSEADTQALREVLSQARPRGQRLAHLQRHLQKQLASLLYVDPSHVSIRKPFGEIGLDSVTAVELCNRVESTLGLHCPATLIWSYPTISSLASYLDKHLFKSEQTTVQTSQENGRSGDSTDKTSEPIAIIGMGCRFPGGVTTPEAFWKLLCQQQDAIVEVPETRWDVNAFYDPDPAAPGKIASRWGGFLDRVDQFDPYFFGLSPREAARMDPQQRLLLEVSWEALERAGQVVAQLAGSQTGVFFGISTNDYFHLQLTPSNIGDTYLETGNRHSFAAGRLSYLLDLQGPSLTVDTVCSSSLAVLHLAGQALRNGECDLALAGGVNLILSPLSTMMTSRLHALSTDGRCKTLDAEANGFVRSEGCGVVVLKRLSDALADRDPILALIRGSAVNHDGRSTALTAPNGRAQQAVIRQALANACVAPEQIGYVEMHGTGTVLGDPIEVEALTAVLGQSRAPGQRCVLGAVKTNIGHTEAAAGMASVIKAVLALQHEKIPANIHFQRLNPHISLDESTFVIPTETLAWPISPERQRYAGVSAFGLSGTNAHVILEEVPSQVAHDPPDLPNTAYILPLSARTPGALQMLAQAYVTTLQEQPRWGQATALQLRDICYTASMRRDHYEHRTAVVARSQKQLIEQLQSFLQARSIANSPVGRNDLDQPRRNIVFVFSGQGSQYVGMGLRLMEQEEVFRRQLQTCDEVLRHYVSWSLLEELAAPAETSRLNRTEIAQPAICALQISLAALWRSWGITPDAVIGHSVGEVAAAYVAGALSLEESLRLAALRGRLMQEAAGRGEMAVAELPAVELVPFLQGTQGRVEIAAYNSPTTTVLSGMCQALEEVIANVQRHAVFCRILEVGFAFHSSQMAPYQERLQQELCHEYEWQPKATVIPFFSTVLQRQAAGVELDATYWGRNVGEPVRFVGAVQQLLDEGFDCFLELSAHPVMRHALLQTQRLSTAAGRTGQKSEQRQAGLVVGSLRRDADEREMLLLSLGTLYSSGVTVEWAVLYPQVGNCVPWPTYPFQRERFWYDGKQADSGQVACAVSRERMHPLQPIHTISSLQQGTQYWNGTVDLLTAPYLVDHCVQGVPVLPGVVYLETAITAAQQAYPRTNVTLEQIRFQQMLVLTEQPPVPQHHQLALCRQESTGVTSEGAAQQRLHFQYSSQHQKQNDWTLHATGSIVLHPTTPVSLPTVVSLTTIQARCPRGRSGTQVYIRLAEQGLHYGPAFQGVKQLWLGEQELLARVQLPASLAREVASYWLHPALFDACLHVADILVGQESALYLPVAIEQVQVLRRPKRNQPLWSHARLRQSKHDHTESWSGEQGQGGREHAVVDITLYDGAGTALLQIEGLLIQHVVQSSHRPPWADWLSTLSWQAQEQSREAVPGPLIGSWLLVLEEGDTEVGKRLRKLLEMRGASCAVVWLGTTRQQKGEQEYLINRADGGEFRQLMHELAERSPYRGVIYLAHTASIGETALDVVQTRVSQSALHLVQAMLQAGWRDMPRLWFVTRGVQVLDTEDAPDSVSLAVVGQAPLWGLGRTLAYEHPELQCSCVDLSRSFPEDVTRDEELDALGELLGSSSAEDALALRGRQRYLARLTRYPWPKQPAQEEVIIGQDGVYLITGGLGGLGLQVARWLVRAGARALVLVGRNAPGEAGQAIIAELAEMGAHVLVVAADIAEAVEVDNVLATVNTLGRPLRGIVHCAGILSDRMLAQQQWGQFLRVLRPKMAGAWHLHTKTLTQPLDFFILFSSVASLIGAPGQTAYASANAFLDTLACHRRARGLPGLSINWGAWTQVGMAVAEKFRGERLAQRGMAGIAPEQGIAILQWLMTSKSVTAQVGVLPLNLQQWRQFYPKAANLPLFADFTPRQEMVLPVSRQATLFEELRTAPPGERRELVSTYMRARLAQLLQMEVSRIGAGVPLPSLGVDSLIAMELRNSLEDQLKLVLPGTLIWKYPTVTALTELVLSKLPSGVERAEQPQAEQESATKAQNALPLSATTIDQLSDSKAPHTDKWVIRFQPRPQADLRLFCFSYAGGRASLYRTWSKDLPEHIELCAIQLPGRDGRLSETPITRLSLLVTTLAEVLQPLLDRPFALFGHSMGALIAFELARQLRTSYDLSPVHLFVSGRRAPQVLRPQISHHSLSDAELVTYLRAQYNGIPQAVLREPELLQSLLPVLRADFALVETATYTSAAPLACPITALGGEQDESVTPEELLAWSEQTTSAFHLEMFPGDHFYLRQAQFPLTQLVARVLQVLC